MTAATWSQSNVRAVILLLVVVAAGGVYAALSLPIGLFPRVSFPRVRVTLDAGDRPAERMAVEVTYPIERAVRAVRGVRSVRSRTSRGTAEISINFHWGDDMVSAMLQVSAQVARTLPSLPHGTTFEVRRMDPTVFPVIAYSLTSDSRSQVELRDLALYQLRPVLATVDGVAKIGVQGGRTAELHVVVDPGKLESLAVTLDDVASALSAANVLTAVGRVTDLDKLFLAVSRLRLQSAADVAATVLRADASGVVRIGDVATVETSTQPSYTRVTADGHRAVLLQVYQQPKGNTVQIASSIAARLDEQRHSQRWLRDGSVKVAKWYDQSDLIVSSEHSTRDAIVIGVLLAALVLLLFLRDWRATLIATVAVPLVIAGTMLLLLALGMSINLMTLGGIAAAVGLIIDDDIVMIEHVARRLRDARDRGGDERRRELTIAAAHEFATPLRGSSLSTIIIFLPLAFLSGVTGAFFKALSITMAAALTISWGVAWIAIPVFCARFLRLPKKKERASGWLERRYHRTMHGLLRRSWLALIVVAAIAVAGYLAGTRLPSGFLPAMDEGGFILDYVAQPGTSLQETDRMLQQVEAILARNRYVTTYSRRTGLQLGGGLTEANTGDFFVDLEPFPRPPIADVMTSIREQVQHTVPGLRIETAQLMEDLIGDLTAVPQPIEIELFADDSGLLQSVAPKVAAAIRTIPGVVGVKDGVVPAGDTLRIDVDRERAAFEGVAPRQVTQLVSQALAGSVATQILRSPKQIGVRVWLPRDRSDTVAQVRRLLLRAPNGHSFPLEQVATVHTVTGEPEIDRDELRRMVAVTGRISGRDLGSTIADVKQVLQRPGLLPEGLSYHLGGLYRQQQIAFRGQLMVLIAGLMLVFSLLVILYDSYRVAIAVLTTTLLATGSVLIGLWLTGTELNVASFMGMTMIVGIVTEVGVFYCSEYFGLDGEDRRSHLIAAGVGRARAIAMTTIAAILALSPLALGFGHGSELLQPLAIAIVAGLAAQLPLVLLVLPALLALLRVAVTSRGPRAAAT